MSFSREASTVAADLRIAGRARARTKARLKNGEGEKGGFHSSRFTIPTNLHACANLAEIRTSVLISEFM